MNLATRYCPECREDRPFDRPHQPGYCPDCGEEAGECPELACTECGLALVIAVSIAAHAPAELRRTERAA